MATKLQFQAKSSVDGLLYSWRAAGLDFAGAGFDGPGTPLDVVQYSGPVTATAALPAIVCAFTSPAPATSLAQGTAVTLTGTISRPASGVSLSLASGTLLGAAIVDNIALTWSYTYTPLAADFGAQTVDAVATALVGISTNTATLAVNVTEPSVMALAVGRWTVDDSNTQADAGAVTSIADSSGNSGPYTGGTGFTFRTGRWNANLSGAATDKRAIETVLTNYMYAASSQLIAAFNGTNKPFAVIDVYQDLNAGFSVLWSAENTYPHVLARRKVSQVLDYQIQNTTSHTLSTIETQGAQIAHFERTATGINQYVNGVPDAANPLAYTDANSYAVTKLSWGEQDGGSKLSAMLHRERLVFPRALTSTERQNVTARLAYKHGLDWCSAIGQGPGTTGKDVVIIPVMGSSNAAGQGNTRYARSCDDVYTIDWDFFLRPVPKGEPISTAIQAVTIPSNLTRPLAAGADADAWGALADALKADPQFANKALVFIPLGVGLFSSTSCTAGIGTTPRDISTGYGQIWHKVMYALRGKNAKIGPVCIYQGEVEATISLTASTTTLAANWSAFFSAFDSDFAGRFLKACHYVAIVPCVTVPGGIDATNWAAMRSTWHSLPGSIHALQTVDGCEGPWTAIGTNQHVDTGTASPPTGLRGDGVLVANAYLAAS